MRWVGVPAPVLGVDSITIDFCRLCDKPKRRALIVNYLALKDLVEVLFLVPYV